MNNIPSKDELKAEIKETFSPWFNCLKVSWGITFLLWALDFLYILNLSTWIIISPLFVIAALFLAIFSFGFMLGYLYFLFRALGSIVKGIIGPRG